MDTFIEEFISLVDFIKLGGKPEIGMQLMTNPWPHIPNESKKIFTFQEIVPGRGVRVKERDNLLGTGYLYTRQKLKLAAI